MKYEKSIQDFIVEYSGVDTNQLRLKNIQADFDVSWAILQIEARKKLRTKLPTWVSHIGVVFPSILSTEQCSSELTAQYKQHLIQGGDLLDLTGGLGVDSFYFAQKAGQVVYVERFGEYCRAAEHNFKELGIHNISVVQDDCTHFLQNNNHKFDTIYLDPARRGTGNKRLFALDECEPNIIELMPLLSRYGKRIVVKVSPMADLSALIAQLPRVTEVHIVSVRNECKELLLVMDNTYTEEDKEIGTRVYCVQIDSAENISIFPFLPIEEKQLPHPAACEAIEQFLYEPNASILKAGAYKTVAVKYSINKLHINSHLYTSKYYIPHFPGRIFEVVECVPFNAKNIKYIGGKYPRLNLSTRNFPLTTVELQKRLKNKDGGDFYLFGTTLSNNDKILIIGKKPVNA